MLSDTGCYVQIDLDILIWNRQCAVVFSFLDLSLRPRPLATPMGFFISSTRICYTLARWMLAEWAVLVSIADIFFFPPL